MTSKSAPVPTIESERVRLFRDLSRLKVFRRELSQLESKPENDPPLEALLKRAVDMMFRVIDPLMESKKPGPEGRAYLKQLTQSFRDGFFDVLVDIMITCLELDASATPEARKALVSILRFNLHEKLTQTVSDHIVEIHLASHVGLLQQARDENLS